MTTVEIIDIISLILALAVAIIGHEIMHGLIAFKNGDHTAKDLNRLSINPIVHIDPIGTILVPAMLYFSGAGFLFGWAKPVPVNINTVIRNGGYNGAIAVSLAGIAYNFALAISATILLNVIPTVDSIVMYFIAKFLYFSVVYNVVLGIFNLFPIPPLDGSQALSYIASKFGIHQIGEFFNKISQYGMIFLMIIIATPLSQIIFKPIGMVINLLLAP
jgi:Zn-dependent protease